MGNDTHDNELQAEQRERAAADDEMTALTMVARNLIEQEGGETGHTLSEVTVADEANGTANREASAPQRRTYSEIVQGSIVRGGSSRNG